MSFRSFALLTLLLGGCATEDQVKKLQERIEVMEKKVEELEKRPSGPASRASAPTPPVNSEAEAAATKIVEEMQAALGAGKTEEAKAKADELNEKYASTTVAMRAKKMTSELAVIGKAAPAKFEVEKWFQGEGKVDLQSNKPTLLVFWEVWCPHCRKEMPELETGLWKSYQGQGLQVVGLTRMTKGKTEADVQEFIKDNSLTYPVAKEKGDMADYFAVSGIPAAAVVKGGKVVWRGHPGRLTDEMIKGWL